MFKNYKAYFFIIFLTALYFFVLDEQIEDINKSYLNLQFAIRNESQIDTNIITLYIDREVMDSLGRVPLKWNYYTRAVHGLSKYGVSAIGIENLFDKNSPDFPTQAKWLVSAIRRSNRVCLGGLFDKIRTITENGSLNKEAAKKITDSLESKTDTSKIPSGENLDLPFTWLLNNAEGFGHLNFEDASTIHKVPLILNNSDSNYTFMKRGRLIPAFALELLRIHFNLPEDSIEINPDYIAINNGIKSINIPTENSEMLINYAGGIKSLNMVSMSDYLKIYSNNHKSSNPKFNAGLFENKIVIIGLIGSRNTSFEATPYDNKFPTIALQANIINTILNENFIKKIPLLITVVFSMLLACFIFWIISSRKLTFQKSSIFSIFVVVIYIILTIILFNFDLLLSIQPAIIAFITILSSLTYEFSLLQTDSQKIEKEKQSIESILKRSRKKIAHLENSISSLKQDSVNPGTEQDLGSFQSELSNLTFRFGDLSEYNKPDNLIMGNLDDSIIYNKNGKMEKVVDFIKKIAPTNANVLIIGESGTGKELFARAIHNLSERKENKFVALNCGALNGNLLESELFGHEEGSYTGAVKQHKGYFEVANKGTIFLDEITETNEFFQVNLLRVLQTGEFNRIGGTDTNKVDVRVIAASNKDIDKLVEERKFREDLYYRLNVIKILIPPLRNRKKDIHILINHFLNKENAENIKISNSVMQALFSYEWPGNIRQLENVIKRAVILVKVEANNMIQLTHLPPEIIVDFKSKIDLDTLIIDKIRRKEFSYNSISETAREIGGIHRGTVSEYLKGMFFKEICENNFDFNETINAIASSENQKIKSRVKQKLEEYLNNLIKKIDRNIPKAELKKNLASTTLKKLPGKYQIYAENIVDHFYNKQIEKVEIDITSGISE
jgi:transcriptional regulator with GAF, ATPase, and Fis domain